MAERDLQGEYERIVKQIELVKTQVVQVRAQIESDKQREGEMLEDLKRLGVESFEQADALVKQLRDHTAKCLDEIAETLQNLYKTGSGSAASPPVAAAIKAPMTLDQLLRASR